MASPTWSHLITGGVLGQRHRTVSRTSPQKWSPRRCLRRTVRTRREQLFLFLWLVKPLLLAASADFADVGNVLDRPISVDVAALSPD